ncbi:MAG TPA: low affinity iron permease family protein [Thermomicrobiales bacterium]|nr:low affinity iron permease family protein [Thermomicrobiales bacterium]
MSAWFTRFSRKASEWTGHYVAFLLAALFIVVWAATGPLFHYGQNWQLIVNTSTTIITFLMVFLVQHTQNHDSKALHIKLDAIIEALERADNRIMGAEEDTEEELASLKAKYETPTDVTSSNGVAASVPGR